MSLRHLAFVRSFITLGFGEILARSMHVLAIILLGRALKPEMFGVFELALGILSYGLLVVQQGFDAIATREVARDPGCEIAWVRAMLQIRVLLALVMGSGFATWALVTGLDRPMSNLLLIYTGSLLVNAITPRWRFLALREPAAPAIASVMSQICFLGTVFFLVRSPNDLSKAGIGWVAGEFIGVVFLWCRWHPASLATRQAVPLRLLFRESFPVSVSLLLGQTLYNFDVLALAAMGKSHEIGLYLAAYRCATGFAPLLGHLQASILPEFSREHATPGALLQSASKLAGWAALAGIVIAALFTAGADSIVTLLFGPEYGPAAVYLRILVWVLPFQFPRAVLRQALYASNHQALDTRNVATGVFTNVALDLLLVRSWGALGCSWSTVCSEVVFLLTSWQALRRPRT